MHPDADHLIATRFDTVIYDLDGTLIDSARDMRVAVSSVLADHGLPPISDEEARLFMGEGSKITMRRAFAKNGRTLDDAQASAVTREFVRYYEQDPVHYTTAFDGVAEVVARLDRLGLRQGVCTNKFEKSARMILQGLKLMPPIADVAGRPRWQAHPGYPAADRQDRRPSARGHEAFVPRRRRPSRRPAGRTGELGLHRQTRRRGGAEAVIDHFAALPEALQRVPPVDASPAGPYTRPSGA
jgi:phosphoglycolate phosphatase